MSDQITTAFVQQYKDNVYLLVQQKGSRLRDKCRVEEVNGKYKFIDQISSTSAQRVTTRHADSPLMNTPHARRRVSLIDVDWGDLVDDFDKVRLLIDPTSSYAQNAAYACGREMDTIWFEEYYGTAYTGETGATSTSFTAGNQIAVDYVESGGAVNSGLTIAKLRRAKTILDSNEVDPDEPRYCAVTAKQVQDLLRTTEVTSSDYNTVKALVNGEINTFLGFQFIRTELVPTDGSSYRRVAVWAKSGMCMGLGKDITGKIAPRPDKRFSTYVYYCMSVGATRLEETKCVEIKCLES